MKKILLLAFILSTNVLLAQELHFIQFTDKDTTLFSSPTEFLTQKSIDRRNKQGIALIARDYPVNASYLEEVETVGAEVIHSTKWLNGALIRATEQQVTTLLGKTFVRENTPISTLYGGTQVQEVFELTETSPYGIAKEQNEMLGLDKLHSMGFTGEGISIAVFDAGFQNIDVIDAFSDINQSGRLKYTHSYVDPDANFFGSHNGRHGLTVFSTMAAYEEGQMIGTAYDADFYLFETEDIGSESPVEELNWLFAAERADSLGIDIITTSLGYNDFDGSAFDFDYADLDGDKTIITQAADLAAEVGIFVVASAGNEGGSTWEKITAPADGNWVLAVGAVDTSGVIANFSSLGPSADGRIKPDVVAVGRRAAVVIQNGNATFSSGTSFSTPIMAGFVACLWQAYPNLSNKELLQKIREAGDRADNPNNTYGYGIPTFGRVQEILSTENTLGNGLLSGILAFPNPIERNYLNLEFPQKLVGENVQVSLVSTNGQRLYDQNIFVDNTQLELKLKADEIPEGIYLLNLAFRDYKKSLRVQVK